MTRSCFTKQHQTCKTKTKTTMCKTKTKTDFLVQTGLVLRPTVSGHITVDVHASQQRNYNFLEFLKLTHLTHYASACKLFDCNKVVFFSIDPFYTEISQLVLKDVGPFWLSGNLPRLNKELCDFV